MKTILVPLDGSPLAEQVLRYVRLLAPMLSARVQLLHVVSEEDRYDLLVNEPWLMRAAGAPPEAPPARESTSWDVLRKHGETYLLAQAMRLRDEGLDVDIDVRLGPAAEVIVDAAEQLGAAMIAMATHGYSGLRRWALGSVTDKVIQATKTPVFVVRGREETFTAPAAIKRIMVPLDGSELAKQALPLATELAIHAQADMTLIQSVSPTIESYPLPLGQPMTQYTVILPALRDQAVKELTAAASELRQQNIPITTIVENGYAAEVIIDEAEKRHIDLIVMATHGYGGVQRWALGSTADKVLHATTLPLLLVRAQAG